ncbi:MAG: ATP-binding protein, partial [Ktedonobacteraceae bacterium]
AQSNTQMTDLLEKSVFEMLVQDVDKDHYVPLTQQHRMPASIAAFVSQHFYEGRLETVGRHAVKGSAYQDPLFNKPFVFIDTRLMAPHVRTDRKQGNRNSEADGSRSYTNDAEAKLITDLVEVYIKQGREWVVIVPYKGQAQLIREKLQQNVGEEYDLNLDSCVSTVDTFQGGERDVVIYGFTRSNKYHAIGFLKELRRLNVALTRAKEQLVMVGDSETLTEASDRSFSKLARAMLQHAHEHGELLNFRDCQSRIIRRGRI